MVFRPGRKTVGRRTRETPPETSRAGLPLTREGERVWGVPLRGHAARGTRGDGSELWFGAFGHAGHAGKGEVRDPATMCPRGLRAVTRKRRVPPGGMRLTGPRIPNAVTSSNAELFKPIIGHRPHSPNTAKCGVDLLSKCEPPRAGTGIPPKAQGEAMSGAPGFSPESAGGLPPRRKDPMPGRTG